MLLLCVWKIIILMSEQWKAGSISCPLLLLFSPFFSSSPCTVRSSEVTLAGATESACCLCIRFGLCRPQYRLESDLAKQNDQPVLATVRLLQFGWCMAHTVPLHPLPSTVTLCVLHGHGALPRAYRIEGTAEAAECCRRIVCKHNAVFRFNDDCLSVDRAGWSILWPAFDKGAMPRIAYWRSCKMRIRVASSVRTRHPNWPPTLAFG